MNRPALYADFNNTDPLGRLRLNCVGTVEDLSRQGIRLRDGLPVLLHDEELEAEGETQYSPEEHIWVANINWQKVRHKQS
jgi:hypothetical protein